MHERNRASLDEIAQRWSVDDLLTAHQVLDLHEDAATLAHNDAMRRARRVR